MDSFDTLNPKFRGRIAGVNWTFCLGAGLSIGVTPSWFELTKQLYNLTFTDNLDSKEFKKLSDSLGWSFDSIIQTCANKFLSAGKANEDFYFLLENLLFGSLKNTAGKHNLEKELLVAINNPRALSKKSTIELAAFFESAYGQTSLVKVAKFFADNIGKFKMPFAIITFNADTLLHSLIEVFQRRNHFLGPPPHGHPEYYFSTILRPLGRAPDVKIPIYHIHGAIRPLSSRKSINAFDIRDKLVFLEKEYLSIVTNTGNWPQSLFIFHSQMSKYVLFGLSLSDANLRRWLYQSYTLIDEDLKKISHSYRQSPPYIWITKKSLNTKENEILEQGVSHLGLSIGWINEWNQIDLALSNLLAVK